VAFASPLGCLPGCKAFREAGREDLYRAISVHGGPEHWASELSLPYVSEKNPLWLEEDVYVVLEEFLRGRTMWPMQREWRAAGLGSLLKLIYRRGEIDAWTERFGLQRLPRGRRPTETRE
jgi:hypothetical protein